MPSDAEIRSATFEDLPEIAERGRQFFDATAFSDYMDYDPESVESNLSAMLANDTGVVVVADSAGRLVGFAAMVITPVLFNSGHRLAQELFWWVHPASRHGIGTTMLDLLLDEAKAKGADSAVMVALEDVDVERVGKLYQRKGFGPVERHHMKGL